MLKRKSQSRRNTAKSFGKNAQRTHKFNLQSTVKRGGYRM